MLVADRVTVAVTPGGAWTDTALASTTPTHVFAGDRVSSVVFVTGGEGAPMFSCALCVRIVLATTSVHVEFDAPAMSNPTTRSPLGIPPFWLESLHARSSTPNQR